MLKLIPQTQFTAECLNLSNSTPNQQKRSSPHPPRKMLNKDKRAREYLVTHEVEALRKAARCSGRYGHRDDTLILLMYRHGLRVSETVSLKWEQVDLKVGLLHVSRVKNGLPSTHPLRGTELRALRQLKREYPHSSYVFSSMRGTPLTTRRVREIIATAGQNASIGFPVSPHMLRHSTGFYLANTGQDTRAIQSYLGHANISSTVIYTQLSPNRFKSFWSD
jgi:type 1 fimbriae regulatory protein FimB/type 1 fimbriae regulatory protein FimE